MKEINVAVTGGAGQIAYSLLPRLISGETFGSDTKVNLRLIEIPQVVEKLEGTIMELIDCGFKQTGSLLATADIREGVKGADWILLVGSIPRDIPLLQLKNVLKLSLMQQIVLKQIFPFSIYILAFQVQYRLQGKRLVFQMGITET